MSKPEVVYTPTPEVQAWADKVLKIATRQDADEPAQQRRIREMNAWYLNQRMWAALGDCGQDPACLDRTNSTIFNLLQA